MSREVFIQDKLKELFQVVISKFKFDGFVLSRVERNFPVGAREVDLALIDRVGNPFIFIETKRKVETPHRRDRTFFQPLGRAVVGQAISYVVLYKDKYGYDVPFFATANPREIAVFRTPRNVLNYVDRSKIDAREYEDVLRPGMFTELLKHLVIHEKLELTEGYIAGLLDRLAKDYLKTKIIRVPPSWALIGLMRSFVNQLAEKCESKIEYNLRENDRLKAEIEKMKVRLGYVPTAQILTKMMAYVLMNKLIFYKVLEQKYRGLDRLISLPTTSKSEFLERLNEYFEKAVTETGDFEPIFKTGVYDMIDFPEDREVLEFINEFIATLESVRIEEIGDLAGYIYEELIPPEERHQFGQFYTPPAICELIAKWCIRSSEDVVLDPGCGSGGFLLAAYKVLLRHKEGREIIPPPKGVHEKIIAQLYGIDINAFPTHLSAMSLAMKDVRSPARGLNIIEADFFKVEPRTILPASYTIKNGAATYRREIEIPAFDAVLGNPPYTRWVEIPEPTKDAIKESLSDSMSQYGLTPQLSRGVEPGIYTYWIMHATKFLKNGGRLGMIISNLWMQTDYGIGFGNFLLDNFKIKAIIDFTLRLFTALISTCVILLEKENRLEERTKNEVVFIHIPGQIEKVNVDEILETLKTKRSETFYVKVIKQKDIPRDQKWINIFLGLGEIFNHPLMVKLSEYFEPSRGNTTWSIWAISHGKRPDVGASDFTYFSPSKAKKFGLESFSYPNNPPDSAILYPALTSARHAEYFTFTEEDWKKLYLEDKECLMFMCHKPRENLPKLIRDYIERGEP
ncbi:hypothetical protein DRO54_09205, partial [Candidatus Bathyarchaeota archaeon]